MQEFGVVAQNSADITIDGVNFAPDPASGRSTSSFADHVQMSGVSGRVTITGNVFDGVSMAGVHISADATQWYESGAVTDVTIRGNTFTLAAGPVILIEPTNTVLDPARPVHHHISVEGNAFDAADAAIADVKSVQGFRFTGNTVLRRPGREPPFAFRGCTRVLIED